MGGKCVKSLFLVALYTKPPGLEGRNNQMVQPESSDMLNRSNEYSIMHFMLSAYVCGIIQFAWIINLFLLCHYTTDFTGEEKKTIFYSNFYHMGADARKNDDDVELWFSFCDDSLRMWSLQLLEYSSAHVFHVFYMHQFH